MRFVGWLLFVLGFVIATGLFGAGLYYHEIFFSLSVALALVLTTDKMRNALKSSRDKVVIERKVFYGVILFLFWVVAIGLFTVSAAQLTDVVGVIVNSDITSVDAFIEEASRKMPASLAEKLFDASRIEWMQTYVKGFVLTLQDDTEFLLWYLPICLPLIIFLYFYLRNHLLFAIKCFLPSKMDEGFTVTAMNTRGKLYDFIGAKTLEGLVVGIICATGFLLAGLPGGFILGMLAGAFNIVPYIGPLIGAIPPLLMSMIIGDFSMAFNVFATILVAQLVDNFYLIPFMISDKVSMNPVWAIVLATLGGHYYGALGLFFSIPIWVAYSEFTRSWYSALQEEYGTKKEMEEYKPMKGFQDGTGQRE